MEGTRLDLILLSRKEVRAASTHRWPGGRVAGATKLTRNDFSSLQEAEAVGGVTAAGGAG